mmetsp:Transcript_31513/g.80346  ORF Transcript_31513/g.80346 Transcript_31513/m.80346 type:complete len:579 (+) Transcript_31513:29-1765(+)
MPRRQYSMSRCPCGAKARVSSPIAANPNPVATSPTACSLPMLLSARQPTAGEDSIMFPRSRGDVSKPIPADTPSPTLDTPTDSDATPAVQSTTASAVSCSTPLASASPWSLPNQHLNVRKGTWRLTSGSLNSSSYSLDPSAREVHSDELFVASPRSVPAIGGCVELQQMHSPFLLPAEVVLFEPSQNDVFFEGNPDGGHRQIFMNTPLTPHEQEALRGLHKSMGKDAEKQGYSAGNFPPYVRLHALRMLQQCRYDITKTMALMQTHMSERVARLPISEASVLEDLRSGFMYWHGRDRRCRPCLIIRMERVGEMLHDKDRACRLVLFVLEYAIRFAMVPGHVENWNVILDLSNVVSLISPLHVASMISTATALGVALEKVYAGRMVWMKIVNMPGSGLLRSVVNSAIPSDKKKKVMFPTDLVTEMANDFEPNQLEKRYGGTAPDLEAAETYPFRFFPACRGSDMSQDAEAQVPEWTGEEQSSLHHFSTRAFHEGHLWDESTSEARLEWLRQVRTCALTVPAAEAASRLLQEHGEPGVAPCSSMQQWLDLANCAELGLPSVRRFSVLRPSSQPRIHRRWF